MKEGTRTPLQEKSLRIALLFKEATILDAVSFEAFAGRVGLPLGKSARDILSQDVSLSTFKDLLFMDVNPFKSSKRTNVDLDGLLEGDVRIHPGEVHAILNRNQPDVPRLCHFLLSRGWITVEQLESALEDAERNGLSPYDAMINHRLVGLELIDKLLESGDNAISQDNRAHLSGDILVFNNLITRDDFKRAMESRNVTQAPLSRTFDNLRILSQDDLISALEKGIELPMVELISYQVSPELLEKFPEDLMRRLLFIPLSVQDNCLELATADPFNLPLADSLALLTGKRVSLIFTPTSDLISKLDALFPNSRSPEKAAMASAIANVSNSSSAAHGSAEAAIRVSESDTRREPMVDNLDAVQLVAQIVRGAVSSKATDVHIEPQETEIRVRFRVDGLMHSVMRIPIDMALPVVSRIKVLAQMNVTERRRPQDGHFSLDAYDFRISTLPTYHGEKIVMRVLDSRRVLTGLADLGMEPDQLTLTNHFLDRPHGLVLVTGPTGSGKTSTLYACLTVVNKEDVNIITIEDPVEYQLPGINQVQTDANIDMTFAACLRSALRQDPDVIMVGEVRDAETAQIAIRASLTGHLVLSTLHTNTAVLAVSALSHMGIQRYLVASALGGVISQRLVRRVCDHCKKPVAPTKGVLRDLGLPESTKKKFQQGEGCSNCFNTGYLGRTGIFEVVEFTDELRRAVGDGTSDADLAVLAEKDHPTLMAMGVKKVLEGVSTPSEVLRAVSLT